VATCGGIGGLLNSQVKLTWNASPSPWTVGYEVRRGTSSGNYTWSDMTTALSYNTDSLPSGNTYYFTVRATTGQWRSPGAPQVSKQIVFLVGCS
jgi:hypothetical protein